MTVKTASGTQFYIGPQITAATDTAAEFKTLDTGNAFVRVGEVESYGDFGDSANDVTFQSVGDGRVRHAKGARDAGTITLTVGRDPLDAGQLALKAAEKTNKEYAVKLVIPEGPTDAYSDTVFYMRVLVRSARDSIGANDNIMKTIFEMGINSGIIEIPTDDA